ncbi:MAG TPA: alpha/beta fold hydrolase [Chthoniobacterales bacterium]|nr:alpha/beta fold hydrolase [Chthoniobacterales bacterium]
MRTFINGRLHLKVAFSALAVGIAGIFSLGASVRAAGVSDPAPSRQVTHTLQREVAHKIEIQYLLFLPNGYEKNTEKWPLILYLHGGSARGNDISQMKKLGLTEKVRGDPNFPFIVVSPQCHKGEIWTDTAALGAVLDDVARSHRVDPDRVYVTGHSMGGRGALYAASRMPNRFAAVVSLGPFAPITAWADTLAAVPLWLFHGTKDQFTPLKEIEELIQAVKLAGGDPKLTILPGRDHYILDVYDRPDLYVWLAQQKRRHSVPAR